MVFDITNGPNEFADCGNNRKRNFWHCLQR